MTLRLSERGVGATSLPRIQHPVDAPRKVHGRRAGRGEPVSYAQCIQLAQAKLLRVPGKWTMRQILQFLWNRKISSIPPDAVPYMTGQYTMNTDRLKTFLGGDYERLITKTSQEAFMDGVQNTVV